VVGGGGMWYWGQRELEDLRIQLVSSEGLQSTFNKEYSIELSKNDESISSTWYQVLRDFCDSSTSFQFNFFGLCVFR